MNALKNALALVALALPLVGAAQSSPAPAAPPKVTVVAKGHEVRDVLSQIFLQAGKAYVLQPNLRGNLYLALNDVEFQKALDIVCHQAGLEAKLSPDGIYYVTKVPEKPVAPSPAPTKPEEKPADKPAPKPSPAKPAPAKPAPTPTPPKPAPQDDPFARKLTTRLQRVDIRTVFADFASQTNTTIEVAPDVPHVKLDAFMVKTSLRYALGKICRATGLAFALEGDKIVVRRAK